MISSLNNKDVLGLRPLAKRIPFCPWRWSGIAYLTPVSSGTGDFELSSLADCLIHGDPAYLDQYWKSL